MNNRFRLLHLSLEVCSKTEFPQTAFSRSYSLLNRANLPWLVYYSVILVKSSATYSKLFTHEVVKDFNVSYVNGWCCLHCPWIQSSAFTTLFFLSGKATYRYELRCLWTQRKCPSHRHIPPHLSPSRLQATAALSPQTGVSSPHLRNNTLSS